jgi:hypothetical protein
MWNYTEYGLYHLRSPVASFGEAAKAQDMRWAYAYFNLLRGRMNEYGAVLQTSGHQVVSAHYLFQALSMLMQAVLPYETTEITSDSTVITPKQRNRWLPSKTALDSGTKIRFPDMWQGGTDPCSWTHGGQWLSPHAKPEYNAEKARSKILSDVRGLLNSSHRETTRNALALYQAVEGLFSSLERQVEDCKSSRKSYTPNWRGWLKWDFTWPDYNFPVRMNMGTAVHFHGWHHTVAMPVMLGFDWGYLPSQLSSPQGSGPGPASMFVDAYRQRTAGHMMKASVRARKDNPRLGRRKTPAKFWAVGEVADHRSDGDRWVLAPDGQRGFDVYDVSGKWLDSILV